jgi:hypothetical protein
VAFHARPQSLLKLGSLALLGGIAACAREPASAAPSHAPPGPTPVRESLVPIAVAGVRGVRRLALSEDGTWALTRDGDLVYWGLDVTKYSDLAGPVPPPRRIAEPAVVPQVHAVTEVSADAWACALVAGAVTCFGLEGDHFYGTIDRRHATSMGVSGTQIVALSDCGCVLGADGSVTCWSQSRDEPSTARSLVVEPTRVDGLAGVRALSGSGTTLFARLDDGTVRELDVLAAICKGRGCPPRSDAKRIPGLADVTDVVGSEQGACALRRDGTVACWDPESVHGAMTPVPELSAVAQLAGRDGSYCARVTDGTVRCWGSNTFGILGDGTKIARPSPAVVPGLTNVVDVAVGGRHACAVIADGAVSCWGSNDSGQLGPKAAP